MEQSIEMDTLDTGVNIGEIKDMVEKYAKVTEKNAIVIKRMEKENSRNRKIIIPMLGVLIIGVGIALGVLSGYLFRLPHQQTNGSGQVEQSKPGTYASTGYLTTDWTFHMHWCAKGMHIT